ncbi:MAG: aminoglycoside phosphotransferase family protein [bacterium]|nr:aminoglycoside phosphotransferase family protein [bacterium]
MKKDTQSPKNIVINKSAVEKVIEYHFNKKPKSVTELKGGLANFVCEAEVGKEKYIVRISDKAKNLQHFLKEQWAVEKAREKKVPTPEILEVGNESIPHPYMISRKVEGIFGPDHPNRLEILKEMGMYTAIINSIPTVGYGHVFDWSNNTLSKWNTWKEFMEREFKVWKHVDTFKENKVLTTQQIKKLKAEIKEMETWKGKPTLNHGDMRLKNVIVNKKGKIIAIHDWEHCVSSISPQWDLSVALHDLGIDEKDAFLQGYGLNSEVYKKMSQGMKLINILNYGYAFQNALKKKDKEAMERIKVRLQGGFDAFTL